MKSLVENIIRETKALPTIPTMVARMASLLNDDGAGASDFERLIRFDSSLTANLLRLTNSAYFGTRRRINSVRQAVTFLGTERVFELAAGAWLSKSLPCRIPGYDISAKSLWLHSVATGILSEQIAMASKIRPPELAFTAGMMHDIGKVVVGTVLAYHMDAITREMRTKDRTFIQAEQEILGFDHAEVGGVLCEQWALPVNLEWAARWHHAPSLAPPEADQVLVDLVHLADSLAHAVGVGSDVGELSRAVDGEVMDRLIIDDIVIDSALSDAVLGQIWEIGELVSGGISC